MNSESKTNFYEDSKGFIIANWKTIKQNIIVMNNKEIKAKEIDNITNNEYKITIKIEKGKKKLIIENQIDLGTFNIRDNYRTINFIYYIEGAKNEKNNIILNPEEILYYINKYKIKNPVYIRKNNYYYIKTSNIAQIFENNEINDIMDSNMKDILHKDKYREFLMKEGDKVINLYINDNINDIYKYCNTINNGDFIITEKRDNFCNKIKNYLKNDKDNLLFLSGPSKIGKTISILNEINNSNKKYLYIDIKYLTDLNDNDKRLYLYNECFRLFDLYDDYYNFIKNNYEIFYKLDDILDFIQCLANSMKDFYEVIIIIDNYDDIYVKEKLWYNYIDKLIQYKIIKFIFCGNGIIFNRFIQLYFSNNILCYKFIYIKTLYLNLDCKNNDYLNYLKKKYDGKNSKILCFLILFKKALDPINGFDNFSNFNDFPSQFFIFEKKLNKVFIKFYNDNLSIILENDIKLYLLQDIVFFDLDLFNNFGFKGIIEEELILTLLELGKIIISSPIEEKNILKVSEILSIKNESNINNEINIKNPIIIRQTFSSAKALDACIIIDNTAFFIQIGLNKKLLSINKVLKINFVKLLNDVSTYINIKLNGYKLIFIFDKERIEKIYSIYEKKIEQSNELYNYFKENNINLNNITNRIKVDNEYKKFIKLKKDISKFSSKIGPEVCDIKGFGYLLFSLKDFHLYTYDGNIINDKKQLFNMKIKNTKYPKNIIILLNEYEDFKILKDFQILGKIETKLKECSLEKKFSFLNCDILNFKNFNIEYYMNHCFYKISFKDGKINSDFNDREYSNYYLLKPS